MNRLNSAVQRRDAGALAKMAAGGRREQVVNDDAVKLVDALFENLIRLFPAARHTVLSTAEDVMAMKRQWILAFAENNITTVEQIRGGMRKARQQGNDFWPSCGKFIEWCCGSSREALGLPSDEELEQEFRRYARDHSLYPTPEDYPWSHAVMYWVVLDVRGLMHQHNYTGPEVLRSIKSHMRDWERHVAEGKQIPVPVKQIADKRRPPGVADVLDPDGKADFRKTGAEFLARIRARQCQQQGGEA